jgi:hypothetical protein
MPVFPQTNRSFSFLPSLGKKVKYIKNQKILGLAPPGGASSEVLGFYFV